MKEADVCGVRWCVVRAWCERGEVLCIISNKTPNTTSLPKLAPRHIIGAPTHNWGSGDGRTHGLTD